VDDTIIIIKDLKMKGSSLVIYGGTRLKNQLTNNGHAIDSKVDDQRMLHKLEFMKKVWL
jgi:protein PhnA